jgi:hypothetical protein
MAEYTDMKNRTYQIIHKISCVDNPTEREARIMEELYRVLEG